MARKKIKSATDQRRFSMIYHDFMDSKLLDKHEKLVFIAIKRFADNETLRAFPSLNRLHNMTGISVNWIKKSIDHMEELGVLKVEHREDETKGHQSNLYTLYDYEGIWEAETADEVAKAIDEHDEKKAEQKAIELLRAKGYKVEKEKESVPETDQSTDTDPMKNTLLSNDNKLAEKNQSENERYSIEYVHQIFDYDILVNDYPEDLTMIDAVMMILHDTLNTQRDYIRIGGENKPAMVVISRLLKLDYMNIIYSIRKYQEQTDRIKNPEAYLLTILFKSKEQSVLDVTNLVQHHMAEYDMN